MKAYTLSEWIIGLKKLNSDLKQNVFDWTTRKK